MPVRRGVWWTGAPMLPRIAAATPGGITAWASACAPSARGAERPAPRRPRQRIPAAILDRAGEPDLVPAAAGERAARPDLGDAAALAPQDPGLHLVAAGPDQHHRARAQIA